MATDPNAPFGGLDLNNPQHLDLLRSLLAQHAQPMKVASAPPADLSQSDPSTLYIHAAVDPSLVKQTMDNSALADGAHALLGRQTVTAYDVKQGKRSGVSDSPAWQGLQKQVQAPLAMAQADVANTNAIRDLLNKRAELYDKNSMGMQKAGLSAAAGIAKPLIVEPLKQQGRLELQDAKDTSAGERLDKTLGTKLNINATNNAVKTKLGADKNNLDRQKYGLPGAPPVISTGGASAGAATAGGESSSQSVESVGPDGKPIPKPAAPAAPADPGLDLLVKQWHATGKAPAFGNGPQGNMLRQRALKRLGELYPTADLAGNAANYGADSKSLGALQKSADAVAAFEDTGLKNLKAMEDAAKAIPNSGIPLLNKPLRWLAANTGDPAMAKYAAAAQVAKQEIAKVLSGSMGSTAVSDSARHEVERLISGDATPQQIQAAADLLRNDMANRRDAFQKQIAAIKNRVTPPAQQKPTHRFNPQTGTIEPVSE